jgi:hypothetical protein
MATNTVFSVDETIEILTNLPSETEQETYLNKLTVAELDTLADSLSIDRVNGVKSKKVLAILNQLEKMPKNTNQSETTTETNNTNSQESQPNIISDSEENSQPVINANITEKTEDVGVRLDDTQLENKSREFLQLLCKLPTNTARVDLMKAQPLETEYIAKLVQFISVDVVLSSDLYDELDKFLEVNQEYDRQLEILKTQQQLEQNIQALTQTEKRTYDLTQSTHQSKLFTNSVERRGAIVSQTVVNKLNAFTDSYPLSDGKKFVKYAYHSIKDGIAVSAIIQGKLKPILKSLVVENKDGTFKIETYLDEKNGELAVSNNPQITINWEGKQYTTHSEFITNYLIPADISSRCVIDSFRLPKSVKPFTFLVCKFFDVLKQKQIEAENNNSALGGVLQSDTELENLSADDFWSLKTVCLATFWLRNETHRLTELRDSIKREYLNIPEIYRLEAQKQLGISLNLEEDTQRIKRIEQSIDKYVGQTLEIKPDNN